MFHTQQKNKKHKLFDITIIIIILIFLIIMLLIGIIGFKVLFNIPWSQAFYRSAVIFGGIGGGDPPKTTAQHIFIGIYAILSGIGILLILTIILQQVIADMTKQS